MPSHVFLQNLRLDRFSRHIWMKDVLKDALCGKTDVPPKICNILQTLNQLN